MLAQVKITNNSDKWTTALHQRIDPGATATVETVKPHETLEGKIQSGAVGTLAVVITNTGTDPFPVDVIYGGSDFVLAPGAVDSSISGPVVRFKIGVRA